jgi:hypothetical protein
MWAHELRAHILLTTFFSKEKINFQMKTRRRQNIVAGFLSAAS